MAQEEVRELHLDLQLLKRIDEDVLADLVVVTVEMPITLQDHQETPHHNQDKQVAVEENLKDLALPMLVAVAVLEATEETLQTEVKQQVLVEQDFHLQSQEQI